MSHFVQRTALSLAAILIMAGCDNGSALVDSSDFDVAGKRGPNPIAATVTGSGHAWIEGGPVDEPFWRTFTLSARRYADGTTQGRFQYNSHPGMSRVSGSVECMTVAGSTAVVKAAVEQFDDPRHDRPEFMWFVIEDGEPDLFTPGLPDGYLGITDCDTPSIQTDGGPYLPLEPVDAGDFSVRSY